MTWYLLAVSLHILAACVWIGGMVFLAAVLLPVLREPEYRGAALPLIRTTAIRFRWAGWTALLTLVITGCANVVFRGYGWRQVRDGELWQGWFGHVLALKLLFVWLVMLISAAFSPKGVIELSNGDLILALGSHDHDPTRAIFLVRSWDRGRSWRDPVEVAHTPELAFSEPSVSELRSGKLLLMSREEVTGYIHQSESTDGGFTWSTPVRLPFWGYPTHCIRLMDDRVLIVYGRRKRPFGIRAAVSEDDGQTWGGGDCDPQ